MTTALSPVVFDAPLVNPAPNGLFATTQWTDTDGPLRWLPSGVDFRVFNFGGDTAFGVWTAPWDAAHSELGPGDVKEGERPEFPDTFTALTTWASDQGNLTTWSQDEVRTRAQQTHRLQEPNAVEHVLATRMLADAGAVGDAAFVAGVGRLEAALAQTNTVGVIHAGAQWAAVAAEANLIRSSGPALKTPLGHTWAFGGGYVDGLGTKMVATSQPYGWRGPVEVRDGMKLEHNRFQAIAERSLVVGYEALIGAVNITG